jgi:hypothetical protein
MKSTLFSTLGALVLGLCALTPSTASAHPFCHAGFHGARCFHYGPVGCRVFAPGRFYGVGPFFGGALICPPLVRVAVAPPLVVAQPAVVDPTDDDPADDSSDDSAVVSTLPVGCAPVYVGGVRCWTHNGFYYRHCGAGFARFNYCGHGHAVRSCGFHGHSVRGGHCGHVSRACHGGHGRR